jgi:heme A synthase
LALYTAVVLLVVQVGLGGVSVLVGRSVNFSPVHLGLSLLIQAIVVAVTVNAYYPAADKEAKETRLSFRSPFGRLSLVVFAELSCCSQGRW